MRDPWARQPQKHEDKPKETKEDESTVTPGTVEAAKTPPKPEPKPKPEEEPAPKPACYL